MNSVVRSAIAVMVTFCVIPVLLIAQSETRFLSVGPWVAELDARASNDRDTTLVRSGLIRTNTIYSDFVLRFEFRLLQPESQGRLFVRSWFGYGNSPKNQRGYRIALTNDAIGTEALGRITTAEVKMQETMFEPLHAMRRVAEWQECEVRAEGQSITVQINDSLVTTVRDLDEFAGYIALESTRGGGIEFRNLGVIRLPSAHEPFGQNAHRPSEVGITLPTALERADPFYPRGPFNEGIQGTVRLEFVVEASGSVGDVRVIQSLHPDLDEAAIASTRKWRFRPGMEFGQPVDVIVRMDVAFRIKK